MTIGSSITKKRLKKMTSVTDVRENYFAAFDGLRAVGALLVFIVHWQQETDFHLQWKFFDAAQFCANCNIGVAVFLVLSGYLTAQHHFDLGCNDRTPERSSDHSGGLARPSFNVSDYWTRRALRILPIYWVCLIVLFAAGGHWSEGSGWIDFGLHLICLHGFWEKSLYSMSSPMWAIPLFVHWYLLFGGVAKFASVLNRRPKISLAAALVSLAVAAQLSCLGVALLFTSDSESAWIGTRGELRDHSLAPHLPILVCGFIGFVIQRRWGHGKRSPINSPWVSDAVCIVLVGLCVMVMATPLDSRLSYPGFRYWFPWVPILLTLLVSLISTSSQIAKGLSAGIMVWLGKRSYSFYLMHVPVLGAVARFSQEFSVSLDQRPFLFGIVSVLATLVFAQVLDSGLKIVMRLMGRLAATRVSLPG